MPAIADHDPAVVPGEVPRGGQVGRCRRPASTAGRCRRGSSRCRPSRRTPRSAWLTVSATTTSYPMSARSSAGSSRTPCGSLKAAAPGGPSTSPRAPEPIRRSTVSPSAASSTRLWWPESETSRVPVGRTATLPGNRSSVAGAGGATYGPSPRCRVPLASCSRDQLVEQRVEGVRVPLAGQLRDDVALGVDHHERRPRLHGVLLPGRELRVVEHRVVHLVALDGRGHGGRVGLVLELGRVDADGHQDVGVLLLERAQLGQDVQAVHAAEGPEVEQDDLAAQVGQRELLAAGVQPAAAAQLGSTHPGPAGGVGSGHAVIQPCPPRCAFPRGQ